MVAIVVNPKMLSEFTVSLLLASATLLDPAEYTIRCPPIEIGVILETVVEPPEPPEPGTPCGPCGPGDDTLTASVLARNTAT